jgi:hypothetical protein
MRLLENNHIQSSFAHINEEKLTFLSLLHAKERENMYKLKVKDVKVECANIQIFARTQHVYSIIYSKVREMQNSSEVFKSNFDYHQRVAHKNVS